MGDKARPEDYLDINDGHVVDAAQLRCGVGGGDLMLENKCWYSLVARGSGPDPGCAFHGATHGFGNQEARAIRTVIGVRARDGQRPWCPTAGHGRVKEHKGHYHDGVHAKGNEIVLTLQDEFGGMAPGGVALMHRLAERVGEDSLREDGTAYVDGDWAAATFAAHWLGHEAVPRGGRRQCAPRPAPPRQAPR